MRKLRSVRTDFAVIRRKLLTQTNFCRVPEGGSGRYWA